MFGWTTTTSPVPFNPGKRWKIDDSFVNFSLHLESERNTEHSRKRRSLNQLDEKVMNVKQFFSRFCFCKSCENALADLLQWYYDIALELSNLFIKILNTPNSTLLPVKLLNAAFACMLYPLRFMSITLGRSSLLRWMVLWAFPREIVYAVCLHKDSTPDERRRMRGREELS